MKTNSREIMWIVSMALFISSNFIFIWLLWERVYLLTMLLVVIAVVELAIIKSRKLAAVFLFICFGGAFFESVSTYLHVWSYASAQIGGIPMWLIPGWGNAGIIAVAFYKIMPKVFKILHIPENDAE